ncbi:MAG TPA: helix-turn-helix domain-containing protein [Gemmatimonadaceae bacterium]|jgi:HTH-type transcriptional regulator/antitoxin HigA|nr:helix-turn-helix domain-containing protein [Gemmatimonadaceae bacterium]
MDIKPIKTEADYDAALREIDRLMDAELDTARGDKLDVLVTLVEAYEEKHWAISPPDPIEAIKLRMEQRGLSRTELGRILGCSSGRVSEILNRKRPLSVGMMRKAHTELNVPAESLLLSRQGMRSKGRKRAGKTTGAASKGRRKNAA